MKVYVGAIFLLSVLAGAQCQCPSNWLSRDDVCFLISEVKANFDDALSRCREMGGDLAKIEGVVKNGLIQALHSGFSNMLVGLQFVPQIGWRWPDGKVISFQNWLTAPILNSFPPSCVVVDEFGRWLTVPCADKYVYVCEMLAAPAAVLTAAVQPLVPVAVVPVIGKRATDDAAQVAAPLPADNPLPADAVPADNPLPADAVPVDKQMPADAVPADNPLPPTDNVLMTTTTTVPPVVEPIPNLTPSPAIPVATEQQQPTPPLTPAPVASSNPFFQHIIPAPFPFVAPFPAFPSSPFQSGSGPFQSSTSQFGPQVPSAFNSGSGVGVSVVQDASGKVEHKEFVWGDKNKPDVANTKS